MGFSGKALVPGFATASGRELKEEEHSSLVRRVQEGISWWRLGLETEEFVWGRLKCDAPVVVKPSIVFLLRRLRAG